MLRKFSFGPRLALKRSQNATKSLNTAILSTFMLSFAANAPAQAWFDFGHMEVACVAYRRLEPKTRARVDQLLQLNPYYKQWQANIPASCPESDRNMMIFMQSATWPDAIKNDPAYVSDGSNHGHKADSAVAGQNVGYSDHNLHKYWHFTDFPFSKDGTPLPTIEKFNAQTQISTFRKALSSDANDDTKSYDLVWLVHIVGDVHQPLHSAGRVSASDTEGDAGGNKVKLFCERGGPDNLHSFWDGLPGTERKPDNVPSAADKLHKADGQAAFITDENVWLAESFDLAKKVVYAGPIGKGDGPFRLTHSYQRRAQVLADKRVELAGERLAKVLNDELK
ncbi:MAG TPA: S1/P1 nuclease [Oculatellaceae cyanobacterium]